MSTLGQELIESLKEALDHAKGEGPAIIHRPVSPRDVRLRANLTQAQMAPLMGMSLSGYRKWEQGTRNVSGPAETLLRVLHETMVPAVPIAEAHRAPPLAEALREKVQGLEAVPRLRHRLTRSISWLEQAQGESSADAKYVFLWIAFNAAYAVDRNVDFSRTGEEGNEWQCRRRYFAKLVPLEADRIHRHLADQLRRPILELTRNEYVYHGFWKSLPEGPFDWGRWPDRERFENECDDVDRRLRGHRSNRRSSKPRIHDAKRVLAVVFDRLYVLRNQLMHGCATHQGHLNRRQVSDGVLILASLLPIFLDTMADHPSEDWGAISFPVRDDIREDRRRTAR